MKVIFLQNIDKLGQKYEIKEVADGYARNFLFPKQLAVIYTTQNYKIINEKKKKEEISRSTNRLTNDFSQFEQIILSFKERATPTGKLFAQINKKKILERLLKEQNLKLKADDLIINQPIKEVGTHLVGIKPNYYNKIKIIIEKI